MNTSKQSTSKYDHWTDGFRVNHSFAITLEQQFKGRPSFTNADAYRLYVTFHASEQHKATWATVARLFPHKKWATNQPIFGDDWSKMNTRNQLLKLAHLGVLVSIKPGVYRWDPIAKITKGE
jgi:hypothetical protein